MNITFVILAVIALSISEMDAKPPRRYPKTGGGVSAPPAPPKPPKTPSGRNTNTQAGGTPPRKPRPGGGAGGNSVDGPDHKRDKWLSNDKRPTRRPKNTVDGSPGMSHPHTVHSGEDTVVVPDRTPNIINIGLPIPGTIPVMPQPFLNPMLSAGPAPLNTMPGSDMYNPYSGMGSSAPGSTYPASGNTHPAPGSTYPAPGSTYPAPGSTYPGNTNMYGHGTDMYGPNTGMGGPISGSNNPDVGTGNANSDGLGNTQLDGFGSSYPQYSQGGNQYGGNGYFNGGVM